jgi:hypothetical protein
MAAHAAAAASGGIDVELKQCKDGSVQETIS